MKLSAPIHHLKRQAKLLSRQNNMPLHQALDHIAGTQGFASWSLLRNKARTFTPNDLTIDRIMAGEIMLLGGRPGHGKTMIGLQILRQHVRNGGQGYFFSLESHEQEIWERLKTFGANDEEFASRLVVDTNDDVCADYIVERLQAGPEGSLVVIDYLQILDHKRTNPLIDEQLQTLKGFAAKKKTTFVLISQVDRSYELSEKSIPDISDVRLPNPVDLSLFDQMCFVHNQQMSVSNPI